MKKFILFSFSFLIMLNSFGQITIRIGKHEAPGLWNPSNQNNFASSSEAKQYAQEIIRAVGLKPNFEVMPANVENAAAVVYGGKRYVLYNPTFINALVQKTGNKWAAVSVLAHEIGHHLNGHTVTTSGSHPAIELEADEFSGFVLRKMGASLADAQAAMKILAGQTASRTHPAQHDRLAYIAKGWHSADNKERGRDVAHVPEIKPPAPVPQRKTQQGSSQAGAYSRSIIGDVRFHADPYAKYYVTSQYNLVKVSNNRVYSIGRIARLNSQLYPYLIYDQNNTQLLVDARGSIITKQGKQIGQLSARNILNG